MPEPRDEQQTDTLYAVVIVEDPEGNYAYMGVTPMAECPLGRAPSDERVDFFENLTYAEAREMADLFDEVINEGYYFHSGEDDD